MKIEKKDNWDTHWGEQNFLANYNPGQIFRHKLVLDKIIRNINSSGTLIDFGSGQGDLIRKISLKCKRLKTIGLEYSKIGIKISKKNNPKAKFYQADLTEKKDLKNFNNTADIITCCDVLEHIDQPEKVVKNAFNVLREDGLLIITLPGGPMSFLDKHIGHRRHYNRENLKLLLENSGFKFNVIYAAGWPFFNLYRLMLISRGRSLIEDINFNQSKYKIFLIKIIGSFFSILFRLNITNTPFGWQIIAFAYKK